MLSTLERAVDSRGIAVEDGRFAGEIQHVIDRLRQRLTRSVRPRWHKGIAAAGPWILHPIGDESALEQAAGFLGAEHRAQQTEAAIIRFLLAEGIPRSCRVSYDKSIDRGGCVLSVMARQLPEEDVILADVPRRVCIPERLCKE